MPKYLYVSFSPNVLILSWFASSIPPSRCRLPLFITSMAHFSMPNSIPMSWLYILTACIRVSSSFLFIIIIIIILLLCVLSTPALADGLPLSLSDSKSSQVSRTLLSILADLTSAVVWMVSTRLIFKSSRPFTNTLVTVSNASITIGIHIYQPLRSRSFLSGVWQVWIQSFPSPRLVASSRLKKSVRPTIYP